MATMNTDIKQSSSVYKITGFTDIVASPVFYSILFLALILGLSSIFGFLQNPRKLKTVIDVIHQKVSVSAASNTSSRNKYSLIQLQNDNQLGSFQKGVTESVTISYLDKNRYSIFSNDLGLIPGSDKEKPSKVSFDYDITSKHFWGTFNDYGIAPQLEEDRNNSDLLLPTIPAEELYSIDLDNEKYSLKDPRKFVISL